MFETLEKYMTETEREQFQAVESQPEIISPAKKAKRRYNAARWDRTTSDWIATSHTHNYILRNDLRRLRDRSRDLSKNDPYAKKFLGLIRNNVIGTGVTLQVRATDNQKTSDEQVARDAKTSALIEAKFKEWSKKEFCSASGKLSFRKAQRLAITQVARDGEVLVRKIYGQNKFGFSIKLYSAAWLDENYNLTLPNGNRIIMSVEVDDFDKPVGYWLTPPPDNYQRRYSGGNRPFRVDASEIVHFFLINDDEEQTRDAPWLHASMLRLKMFDGYEEAELVGKRIEACQMGFIVPPVDENAEPMADDEDLQVENQIIDAEPGMFQRLQPGDSFQSFTPKVDGGANDFKETALHGVAAGAEISFHSLASNLTKVNYSSARIGSLEDRDNYESLQEDVIEDFCEPIFAAWYESAFLSGQLQISLKDFERFKNPIFRARGWKWVDPAKDADAARTSLEDKTTTLTDVLGEKGIDLEDHLRTLQKEKELAAKYGIELDYSRNPVQPNPNPPPSDTTTE